MSQGRHGIKVLGLSLLAALGLMAFAASAQASGEFLVEVGGVKKTFTEHGISSESVTGTIAEGELLVPGLLTINCTGGTFTGTLLLGGTVHANLLYSGCSVLGNAFCKPFETHAKMLTNLAADRGFISASGLGLLELMGSKHYLLVESTEAAAFSTIYLTPAAAGCALPLESKVFGSTVLELPTALTMLLTQTVKTIPQAELESLWPSDILKYGNQNAWLDGGTASVVLAGALADKFWGAH